jgi:hypothetical protein
VLLLLVTPQPAPPVPGHVIITVALGEVWPFLNARGSGDAIFWTPAEVSAWGQMAVDRLTVGPKAFVVYDTSLAAAEGTAAYAQPTTWRFTLQANLAGKTLRPRTAREIEALDRTFRTTRGTPQAFVLDSRGLLEIQLYPIPDGGSDSAAINQFMAVRPMEGTIEMPAILTDYFTFFAIAEARAKEGAAQMPEVAAWLRAELAGMESVIGDYWGADGQ